MSATPVLSSKPELFSAAQAVAAGTDFAELQLGAAGLFWNEFRPADAACRLWRWADGVKRCLTPDGFSVRSRVYEYGGGSFCLFDGGVLFVNEKDQQIYRQALDGSAPVALTEGEYRYGDLSVSQDRILAVEEQGKTHRLVSIALANGQRQVIAEGSDFYSAPVASLDGQRLAWIEWQRPHQPWTVTQLMCASRQADGLWGNPVKVTGNGDESLQQPRFDPQGQLFCLSDRDGWWQPWSETPQGFAKGSAVDADHAAAPWQLGACTWLPLAQGYFATWFEAGFGRLGVFNANGEWVDYTGSYTRFRSLAMDDQHLYAIAASALNTAAVVAIRRDDHSVQVLAGGEAPLPAEQISRAQPLNYPSGAEQAHGFFYPAMNGSETPPLVVFVHGGPTSGCYPIFDPRIQYWTQRGFAVADLNYRGSTGYGRAYRQALHLAWGEADVEDACAVVAHLGERGLVDPTLAFIRGGSAGGYTVLCALAFADIFRGGASFYGVTDPIALGRATHKFEGDYLDWLIGDEAIDAERYAARTPLLHAGKISVPVIFFQGELDAVVPPDQTRSMLSALLAKGIPAEGHFYPEEHHGFRKAANLEHALQEEWRFYRKIIDGV